MNEMTKSGAQKDTQITYEKLDWRKQRWIDISLELGTRMKTKIASACAERYGASEVTWRRDFYEWNRRLKFEEFWLDYYTKRRDRELKLSTSDQAQRLVEKERDLSKVTELYKAINPKDTTQQAPTVQVNNFIKNEKDTYGI